MRASEYPLGSLGCAGWSDASHRPAPSSRPMACSIAGPACSPRQADGPEASRRQRSDTDRRQAARGAQIPLRQRQQRRAEQPVERDERKLVDHDAEEKAQRAQWPRVPQRPQRQERAQRDNRDRPQIPDRHHHVCTAAVVKIAAITASYLPGPRPVNTMARTDADAAQLIGKHGYPCSCHRPPWFGGDATSTR